MSEHAPAGGFNGVVVVFGEGTDNDTVNLSLFHFEATGITLKDGTTFDARNAILAWSSDSADAVLVVQYTPVDEDFEPAGEDREVPFEDVVKVVIY